MITAMQMMLNDLISKRETYENASMHHSVATLETSIELAEYLLEKEKEQIEEAFRKGSHFQAFGGTNVDTYYTETYKNQTP
jgi:hypothetical protein